MNPLILAAAITLIDGDTFAAGDTRYRLYGIDAPEIHEAGGVHAMDELAAVLEASVFLECEQKGRSFGRLVVRCDLVGGAFDGRDLSCVLIGLGAAVEWSRYSGGIYRECAG